MRRIRDLSLWHPDGWPRCHPAISTPCFAPGAWLTGRCSHVVCYRIARGTVPPDAWEEVPPR